MVGNLKFQLLFKDRIGIVFDITRLMTEQSLNIIAMEVEQQDGYARISLEIEQHDRTPDRSTLLALFATLPGIESRQPLQLLPQERRQIWFRTLIDGMSEGILSVDAAGRINTINSVACRTLGLIYETAIGQHISEVSSRDSILQECLTKRVPVSRRKSLLTSTGRVEFYGSAKPIYDSRGQFAGAVLLINNLKEVKEMVDAVSTPLPTTFDDFLGESPSVRNIIAFARKIADSGTIVSITGESGTGKELFARALHFESGRSGPFLPVNCAALPEPLIESELFGYVDGAFTGARKKGKPGLFEAAADGTIFLDEIGDMPPGPQAKILRVLQDGLVRRLGGFEEIPVRARVITATNKNLKEMVEQHRFREDLFYRINVLTVQLPPLRERLVDIPLLAGSFLQQINRKLGKDRQTLGREAMARLGSYGWPGNIRELKNVIERASVLCDGEVIGPEAIRLGHEMAGHGGRLGRPAPPGGPLKELIDRYELAILLETLNTTASIRQAARALGLSHTALLNKIAKHQLTPGNKTDRWNKK